MKKKTSTEETQSEKAPESSSTRAWRFLEPKMSKKFKSLMMEILINQYLTYDLMSPRLSGSAFAKLLDDWSAEAKACGILEAYPFNFEIFQRSHPWAEAAVAEGQKRISKR